MSGRSRAFSAFLSCASRPKPQRCASCGERIFQLPITIGDLFRCTLLTGKRVMPSGKASVFVNRRKRISSTFIDASAPGSCARSQAINSFLLVGCMASGHIRARQPRVAGNMPETCRNGLAWAAVVGKPSSAATRSFLCRPRQKSNKRGCAVLISRASAIVARTSLRASCAVSCARPLAAVRSVSLKLALPSGLVGQTIPSGRKA